MGQSPDRPLSPHLGIYHRGPHMMVSIVHRATGFVMATAGMMTLVWWLVSLSGGEEGYAIFQIYAIFAGEGASGFAQASNWFFRLVAFGVMYSFFQHFFSGLRHLLMDMGAGYELDTNRTWAWVVFIAAFLAAAATMLVIVSRYLGV